MNYAAFDPNLRQETRDHSSTNRLGANNAAAIATDDAPFTLKSPTDDVTCHKDADSCAPALAADTRAAPAPAVGERVWAVVEDSAVHTRHAATIWCPR